MNAFGSSRNGNQLALNQRKHYVEGKSICLLYLLEMVDCHDLIRSSMQYLDKDVVLVNASLGVPSIIGLTQY